ncbi:MAG: fatty acyl-AMP ligase [Chloroflexota bacterium]
MSTDLARFPTLMDALLYRAEHQPDDLAYCYLEDGESAEVTITFGELDRRVRAFAAHLQTVVQPGDRALLLYPTGLEFIIAYLGCLYADVIAVPTTVPHLKRSSPRLLLMMKDAEAHVACTTRSVYDKIKFLADENVEFQDVRWVISEEVPSGGADAWVKPESRPENVAFLQYTSGSTSVPKGVIITNFNLVRTIEDIVIGIKIDEHSVLVSWLPVFHDMGLIFGLLSAPYAGVPSYIMSPISFLERPYRWLHAISRFKGTHTAAPNFAYDLCIRKISEEEKQTLDLSSLLFAANAAEPVRLETLFEFSRAFASCKFSIEQFAPSYGLAEATVKVSNKEIGQTPSYCILDSSELEKNNVVPVPEGHPNAYPSVGCGWTSIDADIRIVAPDTCLECPPDRVGEIWIQSDSVAQGYWKRPDVSRETFQAHLADSGAGPFMRTGDMGFIYNGQIHIAGRIKDMVIIQGRNYYPQDIELTMERCHSALRPSCGAAFALDDGESEHLVVVQEVRREFRKDGNFKEVADTIRMAVAKNHGLRVHAVVLIPPSSIHKTTSGKIQRSAVREAFLEGALEALYEWRAPVLPVRATL